MQANTTPDASHPLREQFVDQSGEDPIRRDILGPGALEEYARWLASESKGASFATARPLLQRVRENGIHLRHAYQRVSEASRNKEPLNPDAEWLLDNFFVIEQVLREVQRDLPRGYYSELPRLDKGELEGYPRIYALALGLIAHCDSSLTESLVLMFVRAYQDVCPLNIGECWAVPTMLRLGLLENLRRLGDGMVAAREDRLFGDRWLASELAKHGEGKVDLPADLTDAKVAGLLQTLRDQGKEVLPIIEALDGWLESRNLTSTDIVRREHQRQAANQVTIGNCVTSLRLLDALDWNRFFEENNQTEQLLRSDVTGHYRAQDFQTRDACRREIERLARGSGKTELDVTERVLKRVQLHAAQTADPRLQHLAYYLLDAGRPEFEAELNYRPKFRDLLPSLLLRGPNLWYFGGLLAIWSALLFGFVLASPGGFGIKLLLAAALALPLGDLAVGLWHYLITVILPPRVLPKLDLQEGIPAEAATFVIIPTMLTKPNSADALVERLELHYLANPDPNLYFALLTDFGDAKTEVKEGDDLCLQNALDGVRKLNELHFSGEQPRFFLLHRKRCWNDAEGCWMGWERKRGKLQEFNRLIRGATDTTYTTISSPLETLPRIRFAITLDSDTQMPRETARRLISTIAHPLVLPRLSADGRRVIAGHAILQPRVSFLYQTGLRSRFARIYAGSVGIDPYSSAISDVYQDLFDNGTFTGKGIYEIDAFEASTGRAFPQNSILSHDLIEGNFARSGLINDVELMDDFPAKYHAYARREHRWIRGDWQLLPWLGRQIPAAGGAHGETTIYLPQVLTLLHRWKIADNLRRSLSAPATIAFLLLAWTCLPGSALGWTALMAAIYALPIGISISSALLQLAAGIDVRPLYRQTLTNLPATCGQVLLAFAFSANQARLALHAIAVTLSRVYGSHRHMLEWETAAAAEQRLGGGLLQFVQSMWPASLIGAEVLLLVSWLAPERLWIALPLAGSWLLSPLIAYWVSLPTPQRLEPMTDADQRALRRWARKTWLFFQTFVTAEDNWLPPDNYQEEPRGVVAQRTSPTNMGFLLVTTLGAHDMGYISLPTMIDRLRKTMDTFGKMERFRGHFYNWYETHTLRDLPPAYVSTVDSGNLLACLIILKQGLMEKQCAELFPGSAFRGLQDTWRLVRESAEVIRPNVPSFQWTLWQDWAAPVNNLVAFSPHESRPYAEALKKLREALADWAERQNAFVASLPQKPEDFLIWLERFGEDVADRTAELRSLAPWIEEFLDPRHATALEQLGRQIEWPDLAKEMLAPRCLDTLQAKSKDWLERLAAIRSVAKGEFIPRFFDELRGAIEQSTATQLSIETERIIELCDQFADAMDFRFLYNPDRNLFSIGYNCAVQRLDSAHYDLLASECRIASFLAIARGEVPKRHWFHLGRPATLAAGLPGILSWGGTMFEFLMPRLFLPNYPGTLLDVAERAALARQIEYGDQYRVPWGISESGFAALNSGQDYMYQSFGVPGLGLKRGLSIDLVIAPYATGMAVVIDPKRVVRNIAALQQEAGEGRYGMHEAIDFTRDRIPEGERRQVVQSYMAHHQGMLFVGLVNHFCENAMPRRLHAEPIVQAADLLLQERVAYDAPNIVPHAEEIALRQINEHVQVPVSRRMTSPDTPSPRTHLLSNGQYTVMVTNSGGGYSQCRGLDITRWREDRTRDNSGQFIYLRDRDRKVGWSAGYHPTGVRPERYEVLFSIDKAEFRRHDARIETLLEVTVSTEKNVEVRRLTLTNTDTAPRTIEVTSYLEAVLMPRAADATHPAFGKLFLETEAFPERFALLCRRRPRSPDQHPLWIVHVLTPDGSARPDTFQFETDRARFLGRRRHPSNPQAMDWDAEPLSRSTGAVLDPILSLRISVKLDPASSASLAFVTGMAETREEALTIADQYHTLAAITRAFELAWANNRLELRHFNRTVEEAHLYQRLAGYLIYTNPTLRSHPSVLKANKLGQPGLWGMGISGDLPIIVVQLTVPGELPLLRQLLAAHHYWRLKGLPCDLVVLNEQPGSYLDELQSEILTMIRASEEHGLLDRPAGVFARKAAMFSLDDQNLLLSYARVVLNGGNGPLSMQMNVLEKAAKRNPPLFDSAPPARQNERALSLPFIERTFYNGTGGFTPDGKEYVIDLQHGVANSPPMPWANVIASPNFGCIVTESGAGYTWFDNSQANRITPWSNDPITDPCGEVLYVRDRETGEYWTATPAPVPRPEPVRIRHGQGYSRFERRVSRIDNYLTVLIDPEHPAKIYRLELRNASDRPRTLDVTFYAELVLGGQRELAGTQVVTDYDAGNHCLVARNRYQIDYADAVAFAEMIPSPLQYTADRTEFIGRNASLARPAAMEVQGLSEVYGAGLDPCFALQTTVEIPPGQSVTIWVSLGQVAHPQELPAVLARCRDGKHLAALESTVANLWNGILDHLRIETPEPSIDVLANRWLLYQAISCRFWGRSAVYQSGGAYGYRDQLQDSMALAYGLPAEARAHLLRSAARQFKEGDAQHWWHPQNGKGIRTRCSDDYLWLVYATAHYVRITGDEKVLREDVPFLVAPLLGPDHQEEYGSPSVGKESGDLYNHCRRTIQNAAARGPHGLPLIGSCDWNDGMNLVGEKGKGESVWNGWFLLACYADMVELANRVGLADHAAEYADAAELLRQSMEAEAWDGDWYRRAYFDDGTPLGSATNEECQIDSLPQSWAVIAGGGDPTRQNRGLDALDKRLIDRENRIVKLFDPPFDRSNLQPGYIKGYLPGIRENGGQYTHAATWVALAFALDGRGQEATDIYQLMNPVLHSNDAAGVARYQVEPYVIAADVYSVPPQTGRGGWTWYTGSASWYYRVAIEGLLGLRVPGNRLEFLPAIPPSWKQYTIHYRFGRTNYTFRVANPSGLSASRGEFAGSDGRKQTDFEMVDDGGDREVQVILVPR